MSKTVDIIIPTYRPGKELFVLLDRLTKQNYPVRTIYLINTEQIYFETLVSGMNFTNVYPNVSIHHITKAEFDHGRVRDMGAKMSDADVLIFMTQDAMPRDDKLIENLVKPLEGEVAVSYARQLPRKDCNPIERYTRHFNYPKKSRIKTSADIKEMGIKTFFCSNVCAAYQRKIYEEQGGFVKRTIFNEDMIYAANAVMKGYHIAYAADAEVIHSHNYTLMEQFRRNFDLGVSQAEHPEIFEKISSESEGVKMVIRTTKILLRKRKAHWIPYFYMQTVFKYAGYLMGKRYNKLPVWLILNCTMSKDYWK